MQKLGAEKRHEQRGDGNQQGADADAGDGERGRALFGSRRIDSPSAGHLPHEAGNAADRQDEADVDLRPFLRRQVDRQEGAEAGLEIGDEEGEPIQSALARSRGRACCVGRSRCRILHARASRLVGCQLAPYFSALRTMIASPGLYSGARRNWSRLISRTTTGCLPPVSKRRADHSTAILRVPIPRKPPSSTTAACT